tara:strand:+ start:2681 stop:2851 length:171 start_codon:yes stop_codon:yes gene_type:complete
MSEIKKISEEIKTIEGVENNDSIKELVNEGNLSELAEVIQKIVEKLDEIIIKINES